MPNRGGRRPGAGRKPTPEPIRRELAKARGVAKASAVELAALAESPLAADRVAAFLAFCDGGREEAAACLMLGLLDGRQRRDTAFLRAALREFAPELPEGGRRCVRRLIAEAQTVPDQTPGGNA